MGPRAQSPLFPKEWLEPSAQARKASFQQDTVGPPTPADIDQKVANALREPR
jgi:hypothetical protein